MIGYLLHPTQVPARGQTLFESKTNKGRGEDRVSMIFTIGSVLWEIWKKNTTNCKWFLISPGNRQALRGLYGHCMDKVDGWNQAAVEPGLWRGGRVKHEFKNDTTVLELGILVIRVLDVGHQFWILRLICLFAIAPGGATHAGHGWNKKIASREKWCERGGSTLIFYEQGDVNFRRQ